MAGCWREAMTDDCQERLEALEEAVDELTTQNTILENRLDGQQDQIEALETALEDEREERRRLEEEVEALRQEVSTIEDRTDLFERVNRGASLKPDERAAVILQTLYAKANRNGGSASIDVNGAVDALGGDVDRTLMYSTFEKAEQLVDDTDIVEYKQEDRSSSKNSRLILRLENGEPPATVAGHEIAPDEEVSV